MEYELMKILKCEVCSRFPDGIDEETETVGSAKSIIKYLLKNDESVSEFKLVKKKDFKN